VGAVSATSFVNEPLIELYDYDLLRAERDAVMFTVRTDRPTLVLGSTQSVDLLELDRVGDVALRRRRGGGGLVLLQTDDLWIDWWIPAGDDRWRSDVHASSRMAGRWWAETLEDFVTGDITVHDGPLEGDPAFRLVCFAGRGPGEVFVDGKKAVGVTQWRVREGIFVSTVMPAHASLDVLTYLKGQPEGLSQALDHHVFSSLSHVAPEVVAAALGRISGPWTHRTLSLHA
jgi:lipoate-protein ligase A